MTDHQRGLCRTIHTLEQGQAKLLDALWSSVRRGRKVRCLDATNGAHFLLVGHVYTVDQTQRDSEGSWRVCLVGMARAWSVERFELLE